MDYDGQLEILVGLVVTGVLLTAYGTVGDAGTRHHMLSLGVTALGLLTIGVATYEFYRRSSFGSNH